MKSMNKKMLKGAAAAMSVTLGMMSIPMTSLAADKDYPIIVAGVQVLGSNCNDVLGDGTVSYDPETKTLNFKDAEITSGYERGGESYGIIIGGKDSYTITGSASISGVDYGIRVVDFTDSSISIRDGAKLDIDCDCSGISADYVTIKDSDVKVNSFDNVTDTYGVCINGNYKVVITDSDVELTCSNKGVFGECYIDGGSKVTVRSNSGGLVGFEGSLNIADATVDVEAPVAFQYPTVYITDDKAVVDIKSDYSGNMGSARGIQGGESVSISAGKVTITSNGYGIRGEKTEISGKNTVVSINSDYGIEMLEGSIKDGANLGIDCKYTGVFGDYLDIKDSTVKVNASGGEKETFCNGLNGNENVNITNSKVDVKVFSDSNGTGISGNCYIDGGSVVTVKGDNCGFWCWGGTLDIADAKVTAEAPVGFQYAYVNISDDNAVVDITSEYYGDPGPARCIQANEETNIRAGKVTLRGNGNGFQGMYTYIGSSVTIDTDEYGIYSQTTEISGEKADVKINSNAGAIYTENLLISDVSVLTPENYTFDEDDYCVCDADGNVAKEVVIGKAHVHTLNKVDAVEATTEKEGNIAYYVCEECGKAFKDEEGLQLITDMNDVIIPKISAEPSTIPEPSAVPSSAPSATPTAVPTTAPTVVPTVAPTTAPTATPVAVPTTAEPTATSAVTPAVTPTEAPEASEDPEDQIGAFVDRIYKYVLGREPEDEGAKFWANELKNFSRSGAEIAQGFIFSDEFIARKTTDKEFVDILYKTFFGRDAEEEGMNYWLEQLSTGAMDRQAVANGFIFSKEWANTCAKYGIRSGGDVKPDVEIEPTDLTYAFVERMYTTAMDRESDKEGKEYWAKQLSNFAITGEQVGASFFLSEEMESFKLDDKTFLDRLYKTFMDREADSDGAAYWLGVMASGTSRADVVYGFTRSSEFTGKCVEAKILPF